MTLNRYIKYLQQLAEKHGNMLVVCSLFDADATVHYEEIHIKPQAGNFNPIKNEWTDETSARRPVNAVCVN